MHRQEHNKESQHQRYKGEKRSSRNGYMEEYSFNKAHFYHQESSNRSQDTLETNQLLANKYQTLYKDLQHVKMPEIITLFLEEVQKNENNREKIRKIQFQNKAKHIQLAQLNKLLKKKIDELKTLKESQLKYQKTIQNIKGDYKMKNRDYKSDKHYYQVKYQELQIYMNQYIASTNQAQEEFMKIFSILKEEKKQLMERNCMLEKEVSKMSISSRINRQRITEMERKNIQNGSQQQKYRQFLNKYNNLLDQNNNLKRDLQNLIQIIKNPTEDSNIISKQADNRDFSSSLQFLKQKFFASAKEGNAQSQKKQEFRRTNQVYFQNKIQTHTQDKNTIFSETISKLEEQNSQLLQNNQSIIQNYKKLKQEYNNINKDHINLLIIIEQKNKHIEKLNKNVQLKDSKAEFEIYENKNSKISSYTKYSVQDKLQRNSQQISHSKYSNKKLKFTNNDYQNEQNHKENSQKEVIMDDSLQHSSVKANKLNWNKSTSSGRQHNVLQQVKNESY